MYEYAGHVNKRNSYHSKRFGSGIIAGFPPIYSYPSYLGIDVHTVSRDSMPESLLGFTDGKSIVIKEMEKDVRDFVLLHEEEHVKDMAAGEEETDKRALKRLIAKGADDKKLRKILSLLEKRWGDIRRFGAMTENEK